MFRYAYGGYAARLLTLQELKQTGCDTLSGKTSLSTAGALKACNFLMEGTEYTNGYSRTYEIWLETPRTTSPAWYVDTFYRFVKGTKYVGGESGVRPAIDVPYGRLAY